MRIKCPKCQADVKFGMYDSIAVECRKCGILVNRDGTTSDFATNVSAEGVSTPQENPKDLTFCKLAIILLSIACVIMVLRGVGKAKNDYRSFCAYETWQRERNEMNPFTRFGYDFYFRNFTTVERDEKMRQANKILEDYIKNMHTNNPAELERMRKRAMESFKIEK